MSSQTVRQALAWGQDELAAAGVDTPGRDAQLLMAWALQVAPGRLPVMEEEPLGVEPLDLFAGYVDRRSRREPVVHIIGKRAFWKHEFLVSHHVLDPRPDTETLVELALCSSFSNLLDLGTGTGCIPISLLADRPAVRGVATDISDAALDIARRNAQKIGVAGRLQLLKSDWFEAVGGTYDLIVSNPPYISEEVYKTLSPEVHHEPKIALTPGGDGLAAYRVIAREAPAHLTPGGRLLVEIGFDQGRAVAELFRDAGLEEVTVQPDLNGKDRVVSARARGF